MATGPKAGLNMNAQRTFYLPPTVQFKIVANIFHKINSVGDFDWSSLRTEFCIKICLFNVFGWVLNCTVQCFQKRPKNARNFLKTFQVAFLNAVVQNQNASLGQKPLETFIASAFPVLGQSPKMVGLVLWLKIAFL